MRKRFSYIDHTADVKFVAYGASIKELFMQAALATRSAMHEGLVKEVRTEVITIEGGDERTLLYNFLDELIYLVDAEGFLLAKVDRLTVSKSAKGFLLKATLLGDDVVHYSEVDHIKSVTYGEMLVEERRVSGKKEWFCQVVLDV